MPLRDQKYLVINEWLASSGVVFDNDFIEIYNSSNFPVSIGGMTITDDPNNIPDQRWTLNNGHAGLPS